MKYKFKAAILQKLNSPLILDHINFNGNLLKGQILVKLIYSGVCGSQLGEIEGIKGKDRYLPHLMGHEGIGEVVDTNSKVKKVKKGDNVLLHWMPSKGINSPPPIYEWKNKRVNAGNLTTFNTFAVVSENKLTKISKKQSQNKNTLLLGCTASTAIGSAKKLTKIKRDDFLAVSGCGSIGLNIIQYAKYMGVKNIIAVDINDNKLKFAKKMGANHLLNSKKKNFLKYFKKKFPMGINNFFECTGNTNVISDAFECLNKDNGNEILIGVPRYKNKAQFYTLDLHLGKKLIGCKGGDFSPDNDFFDYSKIINNKKFILKDFITNEIALNDINDVFSDMKKNKLIGKCIINFQKEY